MNDMFNDEQLAHAEIVQKENEDAIAWWKSRALAAEADLVRLRAAATYALAVLTRLADSAYLWAGRDVPVGLTAEIDEAKARLGGILNG